MGSRSIADKLSTSTSIVIRKLNDFTFKTNLNTLPEVMSGSEIVLDRFYIVQYLSRAMNRVRTQIMNTFESKSHEYKALKRYRNFAFLFLGSG